MTRMLTTAEVAETLRVKPSWVREHAADFGAIRLGDTDRGELRFHPERVEAEIERRRLEQPRRPAPRRRPGPERRVLGTRIPASAKEW